MNFDKITTAEIDLVLFPTRLNGVVAMIFIGDKHYPNVFALSPRDDDDDNDLNDDDDFYKEEDEDKNNPFDKEPTEKDIVDEDFPLGIPEEDLIDDDEEVPYN
jgi:hypothetical protein